MNLFGANNSIKFIGNGNIVVQNSSGGTVYSLNLNDKKDIENFFLKFENRISQLAELWERDIASEITAVWIRSRHSIYRVSRKRCKGKY